MDRQDEGVVVVVVGYHQERHVKNSQCLRACEILSSTPGATNTHMRTFERKLTIVHIFLKEALHRAYVFQRKLTIVHVLLQQHARTIRYSWQLAQTLKTPEELGELWFNVSTSTKHYSEELPGQCGVQDQHKHSPLNVAACHEA